MTAEQKAQIPELLKRGPEAFGFRGDLWTRERVGTVIRRKFGVSYHPAHVGRILKELGWTLQKRVRRARQREEKAIQRWHDGRWPGWKNVLAEDYTSVFVDESGFHLLPMVVHTFAPIGQTPVLRHLLTYDHLSVISAITPQGKLYMVVQDRSIKGPDVVRFLKHLMRHIPGKLLIVWDGATIHRSRVVKAFLASGATERLHLERLPRYAPEPNPDDGIWNQQKRVELKNVACRDLAHL